ncbi:MAG TPA: DUF1080 domain-containing protein [Vicinamibacterales bacterium]|nr:DUF1080 domain-containing protein [Vicinamibacterales bacterium]
MKVVKDVKKGLLVTAVVILGAATVLSASVPQAGPNTLTAAERSAGWRLMFDGRKIDQWRGFKEKGVPPGWQVVDGTIKQVADGPDLVSLEEYGSFDFRFDWIVAPGANSGVMYRVSETGEQTYHTGPEYQVLDNARHDDGKNPLTSAASCHSLYAPPRDVSRPANEWNEGRIVIQGNHVEHWLNGERTVSYELGSAEWTAKVAASKFNEWKAFGTFARGRLALQQHGGGVAFRNLKIRVE